MEDVLDPGDVAPFWERFGHSLDVFPALNVSATTGEVMGKINAMVLLGVHAAPDNDVWILITWTDLTDVYADVSLAARQPNQNEPAAPRIWLAGGGYAGKKGNSVVEFVDAYYDLWWSRDGATWTQEQVTLYVAANNTGDLEYPGPQGYAPRYSIVNTDNRFAYTVYNITEYGSDQRHPLSMAGMYVHEDNETSYLQGFVARLEGCRCAENFEGEYCESGPSTPRRRAAAAALALLLARRA
ncbi:hypothetical protein JL720_9887 [Aureococcus anophagefferens]|nr:hypothetical protein JL720_9887 [Aureococcus anophagefferens]